MGLSKKRLDSIYKDSKIIKFNKDSKFVIMSDCHRGQGDNGDNFLPNQTVYFGALEYYYQHGFTYIELGDGDDLWENRKWRTIVSAHSDVFWLLSNLYQHNRFYMLYGNHDNAKRKAAYVKSHCEQYFDSQKQQFISLFPGIEVSEGMILEDDSSVERLFLLHGHQGDFLNDTIWPVARFLVRHVWRILEIIGFQDPTGAGRERKDKGKIDKKLNAYANQRKDIVIAGHTHRPVFSQPQKGLYFNDGSCVHPRCITGLEIENNQISLVKWSILTKEDRSLYIGRNVLDGPRDLAEYFE